MPSLIPCPACKKDISTDAKRCPHCGHERPEAQFGCVTVILIAAVVFVFLIIVVRGC